jgi:hypothetical protein
MCGQNDIAGRGQTSCGIFRCVGNLLVSLMLLIKLKTKMQMHMTWR